MKIFGFNIGAHKQELPSITETDREWVEDNMEWLVNTFYYPKFQLLFDKNNFPNSFKTNKIEPANLLLDLCSILQLDSKEITLNITEDLRDTYGVPYEMSGPIRDCELEIVSDADSGKLYKIHCAKSLEKSPLQLFNELSREAIKLKLKSEKLPYEGPDEDFFLYLSGIYFGLGVILAQNLSEVGYEVDGFWESRRNYNTGMADEIVAYALAVFKKLSMDDDSRWLNLLPKNIQKEYLLSINFVNKSQKPFLNSLTIEIAHQVEKLIEEGYELGESRKFEEALQKFHKVLTITNHTSYQAQANNNIGYYLGRSGKFHEALAYLIKALELEPDFGIAYDNLGFTYIMAGEMEKGYAALELAERSESNDKAYSLRNFGVYFLKKGNTEKAKELFEESLKIHQDVDLVEYFLAECLLLDGEKDKAILYLQKAVEKGEPDAIELMKRLG